jgi:hypothetical protein
VWVVRFLVLLLLAVAANACFWAVLPGYGVEAPPWLVICFNGAFLTPLFCLLPSMERTMHAYPSVDESCDRLHRAGWSIGEAAGSSAWIVSGINGENVIRAEGRSQAEARHRAALQAEAVGMLAPPSGSEDRDRF